ncbi:MAG TPA: META domain-containing protein [Steroidobacter sp.]|uniref:META domain-containing protein n=1 Tax=Steroidobacter sp. TaxID=1978227 RepID=UPI002ED9737B
MGPAKYVLIATLLAVAACHSNDPAEGSDEVTHELVGTRWVPVQLGDKAVTLGEGAREAYIVLNSNDAAVVGYAGCNRISTSYKQTGSKISFGEVIATRMVCSDMSTETGLIQAMRVATDWRFVGQQLELLDKQKAVIARFEARNL